MGRKKGDDIQRVKFQFQDDLELDGDMFQSRRDALLEYYLGHCHQMTADQRLNRLAEIKGC